jgi:D-sedoheptulose 7-phosphate isomerase
MLEDYMKGALLLSGLQKEHDEVKRLIKKSHRVIFLGNGGSMSSCSHMAHDFLKVGGIKTLCPESPNLITCLANDYGVEDMWIEWLNIQREPDDLLVVISSSGNSKNLINAVKRMKWYSNPVVTITAFSPDNKLNQLGDVNVHLATESFGVHEQFAGIFLHSILDDIVKENNE